MAFVQFARGDTTKMNSTSITDGLLFFNTDTKDLYIDEGSTRIRLTENTSKNLTNTLTTSSSDVLNCQGYENYILPINEIATTISDAMTSSNPHKGITSNIITSLVGNTDISDIGDNIAEAIQVLPQTKVLLWENKDFAMQSSFTAQTITINNPPIDMNKVIGLVVVFASKASYTSLETTLSSRVYPIGTSYNPNIYSRTITTSYSSNTLTISISDERYNHNSEYIPVEIYGLVVTE